MKRKILGSLLLIAYVNVLPFVSRLPGGIEWFAQYVPPEEYRISGILLFAAFSSVVALPLILAFLLRAAIPTTFIISVVTATLLLASFHYTFDLSSDPQAAIALIMAPVFLGGVVMVLTVISGLIEQSIRAAKRSKVKQPAPG
jgi:hypothetical protein